MMPTSDLVASGARHLSCPGPLPNETYAGHVDRKSIPSEELKNQNSFRFYRNRRKLSRQPSAVTPQVMCGLSSCTIVRFLSRAEVSRAPSHKAASLIMKKRLLITRSEPHTDLSRWRTALPRSLALLRIYHNRRCSSRHYTCYGCVVYGAADQRSVVTNKFDSCHVIVSCKALRYPIVMKRFLITI